MPRPSRITDELSELFSSHTPQGILPSLEDEFSEGPVTPTSSGMQHVHLLTPAKAKPNLRQRRRTPTSPGLGKDPKPGEEGPSDGSANESEDQPSTGRKKRSTSSIASRNMKKIS
jgi:hypothetical protein